MGTMLNTTLTPVALQFILCLCVCVCVCVCVNSIDVQKYVYIGKNNLKLLLYYLENARLSQISLLFDTVHHIKTMLPSISVNKEA